MKLLKLRRIDKGWVLHLAWDKPGNPPSMFGTFTFCDEWFDDIDVKKSIKSNILGFDICKRCLAKADKQLEKKPEEIFELAEEHNYEMSRAIESMNELREVVEEL